MFEELGSYVVASVGTGLGVPTVKGRPSWARTNLQPPMAAVESAQWEPGPRTRIGQQRAVSTITFRVWLYARNEPELWGMLDALDVWLMANVCMTISGKEVRAVFTGGQRNQPDTEAQQEAYSFWTLLAISW